MGQAGKPRHQKQVKKGTSITLDPELKQKALKKNPGESLSMIIDRALRKLLGVK